MTQTQTSTLGVKIATRRRRIESHFLSRNACISHALALDAPVFRALVQLEERQLVAEEQEQEHERPSSVAQLCRVIMASCFFIFFLYFFLVPLLSYATRRLIVVPRAFIGLFLCFVFPFIHPKSILISIQFVVGIHDASSRWCCLAFSRPLCPPLLSFHSLFTFNIIVT